MPFTAKNRKCTVRYWLISIGLRSLPQNEHPGMSRSWFPSTTMFLPTIPHPTRNWRPMKTFPYIQGEILIQKTEANRNPLARAQEKSHGPIKSKKIWRKLRHHLFANDLPEVDSVMVENLKSLFNPLVPATVARFPLKTSIARVLDLIEINDWG